MRRWAFVCAAIALAGCANPFVRVEDRAEACSIDVVEKFDRASFRSNSLSSGTGTLSGAGQGLLQGIIHGGGPGVIVTAPLGLLLGAGYGTVCAAGSAQYPTADADFERLLHASDPHIVKRALEESLRAPRPECAAKPRHDATDAVIEIQKIEAGMACLQGRQEFWIEVGWRTVGTRSGRVLNQSASRRQHKSPRGIEEWFADPQAAREEIEVAMHEVGRDMARQFTGPN